MEDFYLWSICVERRENGVADVNAGVVDLESPNVLGVRDDEGEKKSWLVGGKAEKAGADLIVLL